MDSIEERRQDYLATLLELRQEQAQLRALLQEHIRETKELTDLWIGSRLLINVLKVSAVTAGTLAAGWLAFKQLIGR